MSLSFTIQAPAPTDEVWSVSRLMSAAKRLIEGQFMPMWVRGEVTQCRPWSSGHWYFSLRDGGSQVRCCMWKIHAAKVGKPPTDGTEVFVLARPGLYEGKGDFQLNVSRLIPTSAIGLQQQEFERVKAALHRDGLFDPMRKRRLPAYASRLAVVTSLDGAVLHDVVTVARKRWPAAKLVVVGARVQGDGSVESLVAALRLVNRLTQVELCVVGRGGGAKDDLAAFNSEGVCRALAAVRVPTISAVGHETDITLSDLVADVRAATPSAAAELAVADRRDVLRLVDDLASRLAGALVRRTRVAEERVERDADRLRYALEQAIERRRRAVDRLGAQLDALSPLRVLARGYAVAEDTAGRVLRRRADFPPGRPFTLRVVDGSVGARTENKG